MDGVVHDGHLQRTGLGAAFGLRIYPRGRAPAGFYLSPQLEMNHLNADATKTALTTYGIKGMFGYHWIIGDRVSLHWGGGVQYLMFEGSRRDQIFQVLPRGFWPTMEFGVGAAL